MADPDDSERQGPDEEPSGPTLRKWVTEKRVLRRLAVASALGLVVIGPVSGVPWLATTLSVLLLAFLLYGWRISEGYGLRRSDPLRAVRSSQELWLNAVLDAISSPTILVDHRGNVVHANARAKATFAGLRQGHPFAFSVRAPAVTAGLEAVLRVEDEIRVEFSERVPVERSFEVIMRRLARTGDAGTPVNGVPFALIFMTETTAARRIEAMRVDFVANASHELRTPLASILGFIETLQGPARDDVVARRNFLAIMEGQARRMSRLIDDLLSLSKIEMTVHIPPSDTVDIALLLRSVRDALGGLARDRGVELDVAASASEPALVAGDRDELVRVFENLIENAIKYGQSGGKVDIRLQRIEDQAMGPAIEIAVRDYGPGIAEEHLPRLTERFYRADVSESRVMGGTGLGLAIVKHIVTRHRGRLAIASRLGEGATFRVLLPSLLTAKNS
jgi:two-component system, OmpR family, phosphate regulon sensor histidine kinase PhoR